MPIYTMRCHCGFELDIYRTIAKIDDDLPKHCRKTMTRKIVAPMVIADAAPYQAIAVDAKTGTTPIIDGRAQHREYLKRNGYVEVGNDIPKPSGELKGDYNIRKELTSAVHEVMAKQRT
jgi:hypothetical protein